MLRLTLAQMRRSLGRLTSAGIAIAIGTAFVAATLLAGGVMTRSSFDSVTALYAHADLVGLGDPVTLTESELAAVRRVPGVEAAQPTIIVNAELRHSGALAWSAAAVVSTDPRLEPQVVASGAMPAADGQIALPAKLATRLRVGVGDDLTAQRSVFTPDPDAATATATAGTSSDGAVGAGTWGTVDDTMTVVGLLDDPRGAYVQTGGAAVVTAADAARWAGAPSISEVTPEAVVIALAPGTDVGTARAAIAAAAPTLDVKTKDEAAKAKFAEITSGVDVFMGLVLAFAAVALVVASLVISNTFQVLVAQRTRTLALLRCVGADKRQLRRSVLTEAVILGGVASLVGLVTGVALAQIALMVLSGMSLDVPLPGTVSVTVWVAVAPMLLGTLVTVVAALVPARAASRVTPISALRPAEAPGGLVARGSRVRLAFASLLTIGGVALLFAGTPLVNRGDELLGLGVAVLGGAVSFVGVLIGAVLWIPQVVSLVGRTLARTGTSARLAAANTLRNPRRTAATSTALLIGVTLVAMMSTGAASARTTLGNSLDQQYPVDVMVSAVADTSGAPGALPPGVEPAITRVDGVGSVVPVRTTGARLGTPSGDATDATSWFTVRGLAPQDARTVMRSAAMFDGFADGTVLISPDVAKSLGVSAGDAVPVSATRGQSTTLRAVLGDVPDDFAFVTPSALQQIAPEAAVSELWVRLSDKEPATDVVPRIQDAVAETTVDITGAALARAQLQRMIDTMLAIVVGLLAVAVVIALVGVANTLSLSVLERRRESATLRAIGLSRRQLRRMLAIEGMLIAGIGAVLGTGLGLLYGWVGAATLLTTVGPVTLAVPWRDLGIVLVVALAAGLLASVLPGRAAARTSPVAALAVD